MAKSNQARVNGGSNYDSLEKHLERNRGSALAGCLIPPSTSSVRDGGSSPYVRSRSTGTPLGRGGLEC